MKNQLYRYSFLLLLCCSQPGLVAQDYVVQMQYYGTEDGLSHRDVQSIYQDKEGILWLGTRYGLNRFDAYRFEWFTRETHDLQSNIVNHVHEDREGNLWLFDTDGFHLKTVQSLDIFNPLTEKSQSFADYFADRAPFAAKDIACFSQHEDGRFAFLTKDKKLVIYDGSFHSKPIEVEPYWIFGLKWGPDDLIYLEYASSQELNEAILSAYNLEGAKIQEFIHRGYTSVHILNLNTQGEVHYVLRDATGKQLDLPMIGHLDTGVSDKNPKELFFPPQLSGRFGTMMGMVFEKMGRFHYVGTENKINVFDPSKQNKYEPIAELDIDLVTDVMISSNETIWIGSQFGLYQVNINPNKFNKILYKTDEEPGNKYAIRNMAMDEEENLWAVVEGLYDLWKIDLENGAVTTVNTLRRNKRQLKINFPSNVLIQSQSGHLWTQDRDQLIQFHPQTLDFESYFSGYNPDGYGNLWALYEDDHGKLWYTSDKGRIGILDNTIGKYLPPPVEEKAPNYLYYFHQDQQGDFWLATEYGIFVLDQQSGKTLARYWSEGKGQYHLPFDAVYHFHEDKDGSFWLGTAGTGLIHWNRGHPLPGTEDDPKLYRQFSRAHGLNNVIYAVYEDQAERLWLPSDHGIICFDKQTEQITTYLEEDGITHQEFNRIAHFQADHGQLFFGGLNGITAFDPGDFVRDTNPHHTPLIITGLQQFDGEGELLADAELDLKKNHSIVFQPDDRFFRLEFALLNYGDVEKNLYAYQLEGLDKDWTYQSENFIRFSSLPYGHHVLRLKGQSADGQWSNQELSIDLYVLKPFYWQTWFLLTIAALLLLGSFLFYQMRTARLRKRAALLEEEVANRTETIRQQAEELKVLERLKSRFFANVSHELRTPLTLMLGPVASLQKRDYWKDRDKHLLGFIHKNGRQLLKLVNEILDLSKLESGKLEVQETAINFYDFLQPIMAQFHSYSNSEEKALQFVYQADKGLNIYLDTNKFEKIIHNYLSNALKHSPQGEAIEVQVQDLDSNLLIKVQDWGKGIHPDDLPHIFDRFYQSKQSDTPVQGGTGIGLSLCYELAQVLDGKVWAESQLGHGSTFYFQFPKKRAKQEAVTPVHALTEHHSFEEKTISSPSKIQASHTPVSQNSDRAQILIVEDNADLRAYMKTFLKDQFEVTTVENGQVAWEWLMDKSTTAFPDLIISDLMMPVMDGFELLDKIKGSDVFRHLPIILLTARADIKVKLRALRVGVDDYLTKPFVEEELLARIVNLLRYKDARMVLAKESASNGENGTGTETVRMAAKDIQWLAEVEQVFTKKIGDRQFSMDWVALQLNLSLRQFRRRLKSLTGLSPNQYLREMRLQIAKSLLLEGKYATIKETSYAVGFLDTNYFSKLFRQRFGVLPSRYQSV
ncbi:MAG: response regulator [Bacteroidota bacterium]